MYHFYSLLLYFSLFVEAYLRLMPSLNCNLKFTLEWFACTRQQQLLPLWAGFSVRSCTLRATWRQQVSRPGHPWSIPACSLGHRSKAKAQYCRTGEVGFAEIVSYFIKVQFKEWMVRVIYLNQQGFESNRIFRNIGRTTTTNSYKLP